MAREGMDVDLIQSDGTQMKDVGTNAIPSLINSVDGLMKRIEAQWWGPDAQAFAAAWNTSFKPNLTAIAGDVANHGQLALTNVAEQRQASTGTAIS